jgi:hypothetical protein
MASGTDVIIHTPAKRIRFSSALSSPGRLCWGTRRVRSRARRICIRCPKTGGWQRRSWKRIYLNPSWTQISTGENARFRNLLVHQKLLVGARRFELLTPCAQGRCATRLRYAPTAPIINDTVHRPRNSVIVCHRQHGMIRVADPLTSVRQAHGVAIPSPGTIKLLVHLFSAHTPVIVKSKEACGLGVCDPRCSTRGMLTRNP